jgi:hypothetical protein
MPFAPPGLEKELPRPRGRRQFFINLRINSKCDPFALSRWGKKSSRPSKRRRGISLAPFAIGIIVSALLITSYIRRAEWVAFCSMAMSMTVVIGAVLVLSRDDFSSARAGLTWLAGQLPIHLVAQIFGDQTAAVTGDSVESICGPTNRLGCTQAIQTGALTSPTKWKRAIKQASREPVNWLLNEPTPSVSLGIAPAFVISGINVSDASLKEVRGTLKPDTTHREVELTLNVQGRRLEDKGAIPAGARFSLVLEVPGGSQDLLGGAIFVFRYVLAGQQRALFWYLSPSMTARLRPGQERPGT